MLFAREPHFCRAARALLLFVLLPVAVHAEIGDHWAAKEANTPVFEGPDRAFRVIAYVGPDDVIRQQSNKKIRGFLKMLVPRENYATGYVLEEHIEFLGGMEAPVTVETAHGNKPQHDEGMEQGLQEPGGFRWTTWTLILLFAIAVASISWILAGRRSLSSGSATSVAYYFGSLKELIAHIRKFLRHVWTNVFHKTDGGHAKPDVDDAFIKNLLPADFDSQMAGSGDPNDQKLAGEEAATDIEQVEKLYDFVLRQFESGRRVPALWTKAVTLAEGDEKAARYKYVQLLVAKISQERLLRQDSGSAERSTPGKKGP